MENAQSFFGASYRRRDFQPRILPDDIFKELPNHLGIFDNQNANLFHAVPQRICRIAASNSGWSNFRFTM
jgi:hypothetical protein